jgi:cell wall-associated NlpC family hydrolase
LSWIPARPRALAMTTLTAALLLTAIPTDAVVATSPTDTIVVSSPIEAGATLLLGVESAATSGLSAVIAPAPALGAEGPRAAGAPAGSADHAIQTSSGTQTASVSASSVVVAFARSHLRARYRSSATGPTSFDCSGLTWRVFQEAGLGTKVASQNARSIYLSYRARGLASRHDPKVGDLVVWGNGSHIGVYVGGGNAISALTTGVRVHRVRAMLTPFTAYLHTHLASVAMPAWELQVATHMRTLRHTTRIVFLRAEASRASASVGSLRAGTRFVVLASRKDGAGRLWIKALTFSGRTGWIPARASTR